MVTCGDVCRPCTRHSCILWLPSLTGDIINQPSLVLVLVLAWARNNHPIFGLNTVLHILHFTELCLETVDWPGQLLHCSTRTLRKQL